MIPSFSPHHVPMKKRYLEEGDEFHPKKSKISLLASECRKNDSIRQIFQDIFYYMGWWKRPKPPVLNFPGWVDPRPALPREVFQYICSYLNEFDLHAAAGVCKSWRLEALEVIKRREPYPIKDFMQLVRSHIKGYPDVCEELTELIEENESSNFIMKEKVFHALKEIAREDWEFFDQLITDQKIRNLVEVVFLYQDLTRIGQLPNSETKYRNYYDVAREFVSKGHFIKAIDVAKRIPYDIGNYQVCSYRLDILAEKIAYNLIHKGDIDRAAGIAHYMPESSQKSSVISLICGALIKKGDLDLIPDAVQILRDSSRRGEIFVSLARTFIEKNDMENAINFANEIENKNRRFTVFQRICDKLLSMDMDQVIGFAGLIPEKKFQSYIFEQVVYALVKKNKIDQAIEIGERIIDSTHQLGGFECIFKALILKKDIERAIPIAMNRLNGDAAHKALGEISQALARKGDIEQAIDFAHRLKNYTYEKDRAFELICGILAEENETDRAIEIAKKLDWHARGSSLQQISYACARRGDIEKALTCVNLISDKEHKEWTLHHLVEVFAYKGFIEKAIDVFNQIKKEQARKEIETYFDNSYYNKPLKNISLALKEEKKRIKGIADSKERRRLEQNILKTINKISDPDIKNKLLSEFYWNIF